MSSEISSGGLNFFPFSFTDSRLDSLDPTALGAILNVLKGLATRIEIESTVKIDDYQTDLDFVQDPVPTDTDDTALYLIGPAGGEFTVRER